MTTRTTTAPIVRDVSGTMSMTELEIAQPRTGEVLVRVAAAGVCQSDLSVLHGALVQPKPVVLGHEGAGTVVETGPGVEGLEVGDHVVLSWLTQCGSCFFCMRDQPQLCESGGTAFARGTLADGTTRLHTGGIDVYQLAGLGTFSQYCVVPARAVVVVPRELPFTSAALLGCGVLTGWGAAVNTARVQPGEAVVVLGCGGVGLNTIQGARIAGASTIIAVDPQEEKRGFAVRFGATDVLAPGPSVVAEIRDRTAGRGADVAFETAGRAETITDSVRATRRGGRVVLVGASSDEVRLSVPAFRAVVMTEKTIRGSLYGSSAVHRDVPRLVSMYVNGQLMLDELVTAQYPVERIDEAVAYCADGRGARAVVTFD
jgi:alcohol dehydrogenase/S-(hydroxymethyl)glutathione dehydrogenase/alcohol dehydrogenase